VCTVLVNGRPQAACTQPIAPEMVVENNTERLLAYRRSLIEMLFVEGNHFCMFCEKSGNCELQALAYRFGITAPAYPYLWPKRDVDASHPDIYIDRNRCILCARCVRASRDVDGKNVFQFVGRGAAKKIAVNAEANLAGTNADAADKAMDICPVGALMRKRVGYAVPIGRRDYDHEPIGSGTESERAGGER
jgi:[NiFe] hydrogenase diaphorase moiety small subunit